MLGAVIAALALGGHRAMAESGEVEVHDAQMTLPWHTSVPTYHTEPRRSGAMWPRADSKALAGERTFETVVLENEFLRVEVAPEIGGAVARATYKPTGDDLFFFEGKAKDWLPYWESGVKACFPYREHCTTLTGQEASHRIVRHDDGSVTLAMWMEFSRHNQPYQRAMFGHYSNMLLSQHVTLHPGDSSFQITYRLVNPTPYRQGRRLWTDALLPRNHTSQGVVQGPTTQPATTSEWVFPATWVSNHLAKDIRRYEDSARPLANATAPHNAVFALVIPYGFAGLWYPEVNVNRLRIHDPEVAPGAKQYWRGEGTFDAGSDQRHMWNFAELFGGSDNVMEGVEHWIEPGESYEFTHRYVMVKGIGQADFANDHLALHLGKGDTPVLEVVTYRPTENLTVEVGGSGIGAAQPSGPTRPAGFELDAALSGQRVVIRADGRELLDQVFPLPMPEDRASHERIVAASELGSAAGNERVNDQLDHGRNVEKAGRMYEKDTLGRGRVQVRLGRIDEAINTLTALTHDEPGGGEAWHLLGVALLESGASERAATAFEQALAADTPYPAAGYMQALQRIAAGDDTAAAQALERVIDAVPLHWEARLLLASVESRLPESADRAAAAARAMAAEDPADPRAAAVLVTAETAAGNTDAAERAGAALDALSQEAGAARRLREFDAATRGDYLPPLRIEPYGD